ncbi:MAG: trypsin-like peptidase domain-containing protein [Spirochaetes bacterium]|nr:trypsin-like peptidase domain-containing protein [Spirochaetota bacterium]
MKKLLFLILTVLFVPNLLSTQMLNYNSSIESIKDNFNKGKLDLFDVYIYTYQFINMKGNNDPDYNKILNYQKEIILKMHEKSKEEFDKKNYEDSLKYTLSLFALNEKAAYTLREVYEKLSAQTDASSDIFTRNRIVEEMADYKILTNKELFEYLEKHALLKNRATFLTYLEKYNKLYPELINEFPQLNEYKESLENYTNLNLDEIMNSVVTVILDRGLNIKKGVGYYPDRPIGTGFIIDDNGYIITNHHVIADHVDPKYEGYSNVYVTLKDEPDKEIPAKVIGYDKVFDIALLKIPRDNTPHLTLGSSNEMTIGNKIFTIGNPLGIKYTVTTGIISNKDLDFFQLGKGFMIDAAINPGNSGGPLIDDRGQVIGIVFAGIPEYEGINFAIPFQYVKKTIPMLYKGNEVERCWIQAALYENKGKVYFYYIMPNGSADKSGIKIEDRLLKIDGVEVKTVAEAQSVLAWQRYPRLIELEIERKGNIIKTIVKLEKRPYLPIEQIFDIDIQKNLITLVFGIGLESYSKNFFLRKYKTTKIYRGMYGSQLNIGEGDPLTVLDLRYMKKEKLIRMTVHYKQNTMQLNERTVTVAAIAEIDSII